MKEAVNTPFPLEGVVERILENESLEEWKPTGVNKEIYVKLSEPIVRSAVKWQDDQGRIIDPVLNFETSTTTPRFVGALGFLIREGRCLDLVDKCVKSMTIAAEDLYNASKKPISGPEFYVKELIVGYLALKDKVKKRLVERWEHLLGDYDPEETYTAVFSKRKPEDVRNFSTFALAGEGFKMSLGLANNIDFIERYLEHQLGFFTEFGMYRDPKDPMTYDYTARMNLSLLLYSGYKGKFYEALDELLRRGGLTTLLYLSPTGQAPFGGRSNQFLFNEATVALICEYEASRYKRLGNLLLAGAFKRAARLAALSIKRWLSMSPFRHIKNGFPPESMHGCENYGTYSVYSLLVASQLGFAYLLADEEIEERPTPFEIGGYTLHLADAFHKVFATANGYHVEIDTAADKKYDATGLGRIHKAGSPSEIALSTPITSTPRYKISLPPSKRSVAYGPGWKVPSRDEICWLAGETPKKTEVTTIKEDPSEVKFEVKYFAGSEEREVTEHYSLRGEGIEYTVIVNNVDRVFLQVPLLETDGENKTEIKFGRGLFEVRYLNHTYKMKILEPKDVKTYIEPFKAPNRNGIYKVGRVEAKGDQIRTLITIS